MSTYNKAVNYLIEKYGAKRLGLLPSVAKKIVDSRNAKQRKEIENSLTDKDYILTYNRNVEMDHQDKNIALLLEQYHYGITVKKELEIALEYVTE